MARTRKDILDYLGSNVDEASLTDQELLDRLSAYQELGGLKETQKVWDTKGLTNRIINELKPRLVGIGASDFGLEQAANYAANALQTQGSYDPQKFAEIILDRSPGSIDQNAFEDLKGKLTNYLPSAQSFYSSFYGDQPIVDNVENDVKRLTQLTDARRNKAEGNQAVTDYLTALPEELKSTREQYLAGETDRAVKDFEQNYAPRALESANARGLLFSGDAPDLLTTGALDVQSILDQARLDLEAEDNQFYFNAAYQNKVRQQLESNSDYKSYLANEQSNVLQNQQQQFVAKESDISRAFQDKLFQREQERNLALQQAQLRRQKQQQDAAGTSALYGQLGSVVGTAVGAAVGGPPGGVVGANLGQSFGSNLSQTTG